MSPLVLIFEGVAMVLTVTEIEETGENEGRLPESRLAAQVLAELNAQYEDLVSSVPAGVYRIRVKHGIATWEDYHSISGFVSTEYVSDRYAEMLGVSKEAAMSDAAVPVRFIHPEDLEGFIMSNDKVRQTHAPFFWEGRMILKGETHWMRYQSLPRVIANGDIVWTGILLDITASKHKELEREQLIAELQKALAEIRTLKGILPICMSCKRIRDAKGSWKQMEAYISDKTGVDFSHGYCPDCGQKALDESSNMNSGNSREINRAK